MSSDVINNVMLPRELLDKSYSDAMGNRAWKRADALQAIEAIGAADGTVVAVEAWLVLTDPPYEGTHTNVIFMTETTARYYRWEMDAPWDSEKESWGDFAARNCAHAAAWINSVNPEAEALAPYGKDVSFRVDSMGRPVAEPDISR